MEPTPLLEKVSTYGLLPRLWLLMVYEKVRSSPSGQGLPHVKLCWVPPSPPPQCVSGLKAWNYNISSYLTTSGSLRVFVWSFALEILSVILALYFRDVYPHHQSRRREKMEIWTFIRLIAWDWWDRFSIQFYWMLYHASGRVKCILIIGNLNLQLLVYINSPVWVKSKVTRCQAIRQKKCTTTFFFGRVFFF